MTNRSSFVRFGDGLGQGPLLGCHWSGDGPWAGQRREARNRVCAGPAPRWGSGASWESDAGQSCHIAHRPRSGAWGQGGNFCVLWVEDVQRSAERSSLCRATSASSRAPPVGWAPRSLGDSPRRSQNANKRERKNPTTLSLFFLPQPWLSLRSSGWSEPGADGLPQCLSSPSTC